MWVLGLTWVPCKGKKYLLLTAEPFLQPQFLFLFFKEGLSLPSDLPGWPGNLYVEEAGIVLPPAL